MNRHAVNVRAIGTIAIPEAGFGDTFPVTPYVAWDNGEVSGPTANFRYALLTPEHLLLAIQSMSERDREAFLSELSRRIK